MGKKRQDPPPSREDLVTHLQRPSGSFRLLAGGSVPTRKKGNNCLLKPKKNKLFPLVIDSLENTNRGKQHIFASKWKKETATMGNPGFINSWLIDRGAPFCGDSDHFWRGFHPPNYGTGLILGQHHPPKKLSVAFCSPAKSLTFSGLIRKSH